MRPDPSGAVFLLISRIIKININMSNVKDSLSTLIPKICLFYDTRLQFVGQIS